MSSLAVSLTGNASVLSAKFFPPIELDENQNYVCGLIDFQSFNSMPNVDHRNNLFHIIGADINNNNNSIVKDNSEIAIYKIIPFQTNELSYQQVIKIPTGAYEVTDIEEYLRSVLGTVHFSLKVNAQTFKCEIYCTQTIDFSQPNSIGQLLGFGERILESHVIHYSDSAPKIGNRESVIRVECNVIGGSYVNGEKARTLHEFYPNVPPGYKIIDVPRNVIYLPVVVKTIHTITIHVVDRENELINFQGETISVRLHIKKL